jgi:hypothetical protein
VFAWDRFVNLQRQFFGYDTIPAWFFCRKEIVLRKKGMYARVIIFRDPICQEILFKGVRKIGGQGFFIVGEVIWLWILGKNTISHFRVPLEHKSMR